MPEIPTFLMTRALARRQPGGGGVVIPGAPRIPDVSGVYANTAGLGQDLSQIGGHLAEISARWQKAQDTAKLTLEEAHLDEFMGNAADSILSDKSIDPEHYRPMLEQQRQQYLDQAKQRLPGHLHEIWEAKAYSSTQRAIIEMGRTGRKETIGRATEAYDLRQNQLIRQLAQTADPEEHARLQDEQRTLTANYVQTGIFSAIEGTKRLQGIRDQSAVMLYENGIRLDTDHTLAQLEKGPGANPALNPADLPKLIDKARQIQNELFHRAEALEAKTDRDTKKAQAENFARLFGGIQTNPSAMMKTLNAARDAREISPENYEQGVRFINQRIREARSEAVLGEHLAIARQTRADQQMDAMLGVQGTTGGMTVEQIREWASAHKLRPTAYDGAIAKAVNYQKSQESVYKGEHNQGEQLLKTYFTKDPMSFDFAGEQLVNYNFALSEYTDRSRAFGGKENALEIVHEIGQKYSKMANLQGMEKLTAMQARQEFADPPSLEAAKGTIPIWKYNEQKRLMNSIQQLAETLKPPAVPQPKEWFWNRWFGSGGKPAENPSEKPIEQMKPEDFGR